MPVERPKPANGKPQWLRLDKGYACDGVRDFPKGFGFTAHVRSRCEEARAIKRDTAYRARRWVVERTHSWLNRLRRILVRRQKLPESCIAMLHLVFGIIAWCATVTPGA